MFETELEPDSAQTGQNMLCCCVSCVFVIVLQYVLIVSAEGTADGK